MQHRAEEELTSTNRMKHIEIAGRKIGPEFPPLVIAEIGINHEGSYEKAIRMVDDAAAAGCECAKVSIARD